MAEQAAVAKVKQARRCVACGESVTKRQLLRVVRTAEGNVAYDATGHANGRGAYVCANAECIAKARRKKLLQTSLKAQATDALYDELERAAGNGGK